jgi:hypothetical protein
MSFLLSFLFVRKVMLLQTLVYTCESAIGGVAGNIEKLTLLPAGRTLLGRFLNLDRIAAIAALPEHVRKLRFIFRHRLSSFPFSSEY